MSARSELCQASTSARIPPSPARASMMVGENRSNNATLVDRLSVTGYAYTVVPSLSNIGGTSTVYGFYDAAWRPITAA